MRKQNGVVFRKQFRVTYFVGGRFVYGVHVINRKDAIYKCVYCDAFTREHVIGAEEHDRIWDNFVNAGGSLEGGSVRIQIEAPATVEAPARVGVKKACNYLDNTVVEKQGEWVFVWDCYANRFWAYNEVTNEKKDFICYTDWQEFNPYTEPTEPTEPTESTESTEPTLQEVAETAVAKLDSVVETKHTAQVDRFYIHNYKNGATRLYWFNKSALACGYKTLVYRDGVETVVRNERFRDFIAWEQSRESYTKYCKANALKGGE